MAEHVAEDKRVHPGCGDASAEAQEVVRGVRGPPDYPDARVCRPAQGYPLAGAVPCHVAWLCTNAFNALYFEVLW